MKVLVINCGSSSLKFQVIEIAGEEPGISKSRRLARGLVDRIGSQAACRFVAGHSSPHEETASIRDHAEAVEKVLKWLADQGGGISSNAVGHRVVHGGDRFTTSVLIDEEVVAAIEGFNDLAPLHNPACLSGIRAARGVLGPSMPMAAVFDTSFHHTLPGYASTYAIPHELSLRHRIRRYGFHGLAHRYARRDDGHSEGTGQYRYLASR
jgi:acetate kinase